MSEVIIALFLGVVAVAFLDPYLGEEGWIALLAAGVIMVALFCWYLYHQRAKHRAHIFSKYGDTEIARSILDNKFWEGMSADELTDSLGKPASIDDKKLKTKRKQVWKYQQEGQKSYRLRITVEDGVVTGWQKRGA